MVKVKTLASVWLSDGDFQKAMKAGYTGDQQIWACREISLPDDLAERLLERGLAEKVQTLGDLTKTELAAMVVSKGLAKEGELGHLKKDDLIQLLNDNGVF